MIKNIIFDFDGTLADSLNLFIKIYNEIHKSCACPSFDIRDKDRLRDLSVAEILKEYQISAFKVPILAFKAKRKLGNKLNELELFPGIKEALQDLKNRGYSLHVLSSNSKSNLIAFLKQEEILTLFSSVYGGASLFSKARKIKKLFKREGINSQNSLYIGDEIREIEACRNISLPIISVTWGFNSKQSLEKLNPNMIVDSIIELLNRIYENTSSDS